MAQCWFTWHVLGRSVFTRKWNFLTLIHGFRPLAKWTDDFANLANWNQHYAWCGKKWSSSKLCSNLSSKDQNNLGSKESFVCKLFGFIVREVRLLMKCIAQKGHYQTVYRKEPDIWTIWNIWLMQKVMHACIASFFLFPGKRSESLHRCVFYYVVGMKKDHC